MKRAQVLLLALALLAVPLHSGGKVKQTTVTTDVSGAASVTTHRVNGQILYIRYLDGFADTADFTITCTRTGVGLWTESNVTAADTVHPTVAVQDQVGGDRAQYDFVPCIESTVTIVIAQGGDTQSAIFEIAWF